MRGFFAGQGVTYFFAGAIVVGVTVAAGAVIEVRAVSSDFYAAVAAAIPVFTLAILVLIGLATDRRVRARLDFDRILSDVSEMLPSLEAEADGDDGQQEMTELRATLKTAEASRLRRPDRFLRNVFGASFAVSFIGEAGALYALAARSTTLPFCMSVFGLVAIFTLLFIIEDEQLRLREPLTELADAFARFREEHSS
jgi:hypothetical protein